MSWYPVEWARLIDMVVVKSETQQEPPDIGDTRGPGWHWDRGGASYYILETWDDDCWDPGGITHHIIYLTIEGIGELMDKVTKHPHTFRSLLVLVTDWIDSGEWRLHKFFGHVGYVGSHKMISILQQEFVRGGGIGKPPNRELYGHDFLLLMYWLGDPLRIHVTPIFPLACVELGRLSLLGQMKRYDTRHGGFTSKVANTFVHVG